MKQSLLSTRYAKKRSSHKGIKTKETSKYSAKTLVHTQTKQWVQTPTMIIRRKSYSRRRLQPPIREHLDFFQQKMRGTCCVVEQTMVSFIPYDPNVGKPNKLQKRPPSSETPNWVCEMNKVVRKSVSVHRRKANPRANHSPQRSKWTAREE
jgi:hypothetical protein